MASGRRQDLRAMGHRARECQSPVPKRPMDLGSTMMPTIPWLADLRAERFLRKRMGTAAYATFQLRGFVDVPIPDGTYKTFLGQTALARAAVRVAANAKMSVVSQDDGRPIGDCCVYAVDDRADFLTDGRSRLPAADQIYALWFLARVDPHR